jgi:phage-related protein
VPVILDAVILIVQTLIQNAPLLLEAALTLITALAQGLIDYIPELIDRLPEIIASIVETLVGMSGEILSAGIELLIALGAGLIEAIPELIMNIPEILTAMVDGLLEGLGSFAEVGADLIEGLWNGIQDAKEWIMDKIAGFADDVLDGIKDFFGIHSPSTEMAEIGDYMAQGLAKGWDDSVGDVIDKMNDDMDLEGNVQFEADTEGFDETPTFAGSGAQLAGAAGDIIIPVYIGQTKLDEVLVRAEQLRNYRSGGR